MKIALISTHPIQYQIPWFQGLDKSEKIDFKVFFGLLPNEQQQAVGFGGKFSWDIPLLEGYSYQVLKNKTKNSNLDNFGGVKSLDMTQQLKKWQPDVIILIGWHSYLLIQGLIASKYLKIPVLVRGDSNYLAPRKWYQRCFHKLLLSQYDAFLTVGKANTIFYRNYKISHNKMFNSPHFIDNKRFKMMVEKLENNKSELRKKYQIPEKSICFLYSGKLIPKKRIMDLLQALKKVREKVNTIYLLVVGSGELMSQAKQYVDKYSLPVSFSGFINQLEIPETYIVSDCLVLPSNYMETWGLVVNEAMACGLPAIVSDQVGCASDLVEEGITGSVFPFGNIEILTEKMIHYAQDLQQLKTMGKTAQKSVCENYSVEKTVEGTLQAIKFVTKK